MKRMWSKNELKNIADIQAKGVKKDIASLVDADGNPRFAEGDITMDEVEGFTQTYGKWSLSGSHLMIVLAGLVADTTAYTGGKLASVNLPQWIIDKIAIIFSAVVSFKSIPAYAANWSTQNLSVALRKPSTSSITITGENSVTFTADRAFRIEFDLLIDIE